MLNSLAVKKFVNSEVNLFFLSKEFALGHFNKHCAEESQLKIPLAEISFKVYHYYIRIYLYMLYPTQILLSGART